MSQSLLATRTTTSEIQIEIDWPLLLEQRSAVMRHTETPAYLLLPEIHQLMDVVRQDNLLLMINTLWHTGARISECLALTPNHFVLDTKQPYVSVETLKSRGRPKRAGRIKPRLVPLCDSQFIRQMERYIASHHIRKNQLLFPITRSAANKRFDRLVANMTHKPSIKITPHTFRHYLCRQRDFSRDALAGVARLVRSCRHQQYAGLYSGSVS
jgi:integrase